MSDKQSIRDDLIGELDKATDYYGRAYNGYGQLADHLLSSPVIRRIEAEAFEQGKQAGFTQADGEWRTAIEKVRTSRERAGITFTGMQVSFHELAQILKALEQAQEKVASLQSSMDDMVDIDSEYIYRLKDDLARAEETIEQVRAWRRSKDLRGQLPDSAHEELIAILAAHTKETP